MSLSRNNRVWTRRCAACLIAAFACFGLLAGCEQEREPATNAVLEDVAESGHEVRGPGAANIGERITISGDIQQTYGVHAALLGADAWTEDLLVVSVNALPEEAEVGRMLQVTGPVLQRSVAEIEADLGVDFSQEIDTEIKTRRKYVVADAWDMVAVE